MGERKRRIGCIVPASNVMAETDFIALCPAGATVHFARADHAPEDPLAAQLDSIVASAPRHAASLAKAGVGVVAFTCTVASLHRGPGSDLQIVQAMEEAAHVPALTTAGAVIEALRALGAARIGVATPYVGWLCEAERAFLEAAGVDVLDIIGLGLSRNADIQAVPPAQVTAMACAVDRAAADAIFISCTNLQSLTVIRALEAELGKPVVTSNQATFFDCARRLGLGPIRGFGRLLERHLREQA